MNILSALKSSAAPTSLQEKLEQAGLYISAAFFFSIYISTPVSIIFSALMGVVWLGTAQYKKLPLILKNSTVNLWALLVFCGLIIDLSYTSAPEAVAHSMLRKYREFAYIPVLSCFFTQPRYRQFAWYAFIAASLVTLLSSYLMELELMSLNRYGTFTLKSRITHSIFIAFFMFFCLHQYLDAKKYKLIYLALLAICINNLYFVTDGRIGQFAFLLLVPVFVLQRYSKKLTLISLCILAVCMVSYTHFSDKSARINQGLDTAMLYFGSKPGSTDVSSNLRLKYWSSAVKLIKEKPLLGHGTGSFGPEYRRITNNKAETLENPHNEFLSLTVQGGMLGLALYLGFLYSQYRDAQKLPDKEKWLAQGVLLTLIVTSLFNSPFLDHTEGHWFAVMIALCYASLSSGKTKTTVDSPG